MRRRSAILLVTLALAMTGCAAAETSASPDVSDLFSSDEVAAAKAECLQEKGWDVEVQDGVIRAEVPEAQAKAYERDSAVCHEEAGGDMPEELSDEQLGEVYAWYSEIADCLENHQYPVPSKPSEQAFKESYSSDPWLPWIELDGLQLSKATEQCPSMQPSAG